MLYVTIPPSTQPLDRTPTSRVDINRQHPESTATHALSSSDAKTSGTGPEQLETRILVINATPGSGASQEAGTSGENGAGAGGAENPNSDKGADDRAGTAKGKGKGDAGMRGGYVGLMNCVFAAQKAVSAAEIRSSPHPKSHMPVGNGWDNGSFCGL